MARQRLHKILAAAGVGSRRRCEELIAEGHVTVDGEEVRSMGFLVDPDAQDIRFDGERIVLETPVYYAVHKPAGYICSNVSQDGRRTVVSLVRDRRHRRLYTVGRLDEDSEGLILVTNDGELAHRLAHPRHGVDKTYVLKLRGSLGPEALEKARSGVWLSTGRTQSMFVKIVRRTKQLTNVLVVLQEGKNRELRRIFAKVGHPVLKLKRVRVGTLKLDGLRRGQARKLTQAEVDELIASCEKRAATAPSAPRPPRRSRRSERWPGEKSGSRRRR